MSESQFKTIKYQPVYPRRFDSYDHAMRWCEDYVVQPGSSPLQVFTGEYLEVAQVRQMAFDDIYDRHPERFKGRPTVQMPATEVCINPVKEGADQATVE